MRLVLRYEYHLADAGDTFYRFILQAGNATASTSESMDMNAVAGEVPFEYIIKGLDQKSSESAGFDIRVSALNGAGYGRPSAPVNVKVNV